MASVLRVGWCLISSSIAVPRLEAVSPAQTQTQTQTTHYDGELLTLH